MTLEIKHVEQSYGTYHKHNTFFFLEGRRTVNCVTGRQIIEIRANTRAYLKYHRRPHCALESLLRKRSIMPS